MSNILNSDDFGLKIYNRFPLKYREDDVGQNLALKRYLESLSDGGFKYSIDDINGITHLIDPDNTKEKVLPILFKQYGLEIFNGIPEQYLRYLLPKLGEAWSKKGSLSVVEFISSSISGVKTSSVVEYDGEGNPTIDVKLEMDYTLGDYFPEAEQFRRLLQNFVPFYSDVVIIYSYLFYESHDLKGRIQEQMSILDNVQDGGSINSFEEEYCLNKIHHLLSENVKIVVSEYDDYLKQSLKLLAVKESSNVKCLEKVVDNMSNLSEDKGLFRLYSGYHSDSAVLGKAVFGVSVMGVGGFDIDTFSDEVKDTSIDAVNIINTVDSYLNREHNTLNGYFNTNGMYSYDLVTVNGITEIVY